MVHVRCCLLDARNDFIFNNKIISSPRALIFCLISVAGPDGGKYRCEQSSNGTDGGRNQVTGA
jgi:hypothetical protein